MQAGVGRKHSHQRHTGKIMPFGDHLGADEDIYGAILQSLQHSGVPPPAGGGIAIHTTDSGRRIKVADLIFDTLGAPAQQCD